MVCTASIGRGLNLETKNLFEPTWISLKRHATTQWFLNSKFDIYTHLGVYSVPACGPNATWYPYNMFPEGTEQQKIWWSREI
jgi:hypothetical protein